MAEVDVGSKVESEKDKKLVGVALIKQEYIVTDHVRSLAVECISENDKRKLDIDSSSEEPAKRQRLSKKEMKLRGQNKSRGPTFVVDKEITLCPELIDRTEASDLIEDGKKFCRFTNCKCMHSVQEYLAIKPPDIGGVCYNYMVRGRCPRGLMCRFGSQHTNADGTSKINKEVYDKFVSDKTSQTFSCTKDILIKLRKKQYNFDRSKKVIEIIDKKYAMKKNKSNVNNGNIKEGTTDSLNETRIGPVDDSDLIKLRQCEKKKIDWRDKLYLSPLTTVGNLPFRRICKEFGADVTCGEMAMAHSLLQGCVQEWALTKRHGTEDLFGVQVCGNNHHVLTRCAQALQENTHIDFVDLNLGCPIDMVYKQGGGSGLLLRKNVLFNIVNSMNSVLDIPLTVKTRTGIYQGKNVAHEYMKDFSTAGVSLITVHGRTKEQRYTRLADWDYIEQCAKLAAPTPVFGNGDILSFCDYEALKERSPTVAGCMLGRGSLIKPWIFTEIKERRHWDITSSERFEIIKKYVNYGLEHWGSDTKGVENTRRFLLEWLSFLYRYIPVGLLESPPQKINERPSVYRGRDDLETLMASGNCADWVKISEMVLGPVPEGFNFLPKHKANSWK